MSSLQSSITSINSDLLELEDDISICIPLQEKVAITGGSDAYTTTLTYFHVYLLIFGHPYSGCAMYLLTAIGGSNNDISPILESSNITIAISGATLSVESTKDYWMYLIDIGANP